ncbi:hypothetical protein SRHO_G00233820 [Serrasalmus rhombeus]
MGRNPEPLKRVMESRFQKNRFCDPGNDSAFSDRSEERKPNATANNIRLINCGIRRIQPRGKTQNTTNAALDNFTLNQPNWLKMVYTDIIITTAVGWTGLDWIRDWTEVEQSGEGLSHRVHW